MKKEIKDIIREGKNLKTVLNGLKGITNNNNTKSIIESLIQKVDSHISIYQKQINDSPVKIKERWAKIPGTDCFMSNTGRVINGGKTVGLKNHELGRELKPSIQGNQEYVSLIINGERKRISISNLMVLTFRIAKPKVEEKKMIPGSKTTIWKEKTRMVIKKIDELKPFSLDNLAFDFWWRGEQHWNHILDNDLVKLIRSKANMKFKDFMKEHGNIFRNRKISTYAVRKVFMGDSWRVRTKPISEMTYPEEHYPDGNLIDLTDENRINWL